MPVLDLGFDLLRVGPLTFPIRWVENLHDGDKELFGQVCYSPCEIRLQTGMEAQHAGLTVLHELIHAILSVCPVDLEEEGVTLLTFGLADAFQRNPGLVKLLGGR